MTAPVIRPGRPGDCDAIADMVRRLAIETGQSFRPLVTGDDLRAEAFRPDGILSLVVAEAEGRVVGMLVGSLIYSTWRAGRGVYVVDLYIEAAHRGGGLGARMVAEAARIARAAGGTFVKLEVVAGNDRAKAFYRRLGFAPVEGDENYVLAGEPFLKLSAP